MPFIGAAVGAVVGAIGAAGSAIVGAIGAVGSFIGGLGFVGQTLVGIGLNVAGSLLQRAFAKKPSRPPGGVQFDRQYGADVSRQVACGYVGIAGHDCYVNTYGASNKFLQQVYTLSDYYSDGFSRLAINGKWETLGAEEDPEKGWPVTSGEFAGLIWLKFLDGRQTAADPYLVDKANPASRWTADHIGVGITAVLISMTFDREKNSQFPEFFFEYRGAPLYDWRKDSTVGGVGNHRWGDPSTHEFSENPIVMDYNYRRGFSVNGDLFCGMDMPAGDLPLDKYTAAANICDEATADGPRYRCSVMLDAGPETTHGDNIESLMLSCGGMVIDGVAGSWPIVGSDQPIVMTMTDEDLIQTEPVQFRAKRSMAELVNSVAGNHPNPDELWSMVGYDPQISEAAIAVDRRTRDLGIDFPQVRHGAQAAQLASIYLKENRFEASATVTARPRFQVLEPGDWFRWNSKRYGDRVFMVSEQALASLSSSGPRNATMSMQERDGSIYDPTSSPAIVLPTPAGAPAYLAEVQDFTLVAVSVSGSDGKIAPAIRASWSSIEDVTVTGIEVEYWPEEQPEAVLRRVVPIGTTVVLLAEGVLGSTLYRVRTKLVTEPARVTAWSAGDTVETVVVPRGSIYPVNLDDLGADVQGKFDGIDQTLSTEVADRIATVAANARAIRVRQEEVVELASLVMEARADDYGKRQEIRRGFVLDLGNARASFDERIVGLVAEDQALALRITDISASLDQSNAQILEVEEASVSRDDALAADLQQVSAAIGELESEGFDSLNTKVNRLADGQESQAQSLRGVRGSLEVSFEQQMEAAAVAYDGKKAALKASASAYSQLDQSIRQVGERVDLNASAITAVQTSLGGKAESSALTALETTVSQQGDTITANSEALTAVTAEVGDATAGGYLKMTGSAGPAGVLAEVDIAVRAAVGGTVGRAAISLQAYDDGGVIKTRALHIADEFIITDGTSQALPFVFQGGVAVMNASRVNGIEAGTLKSLNDKVVLNLTTGLLTMDD